MSVRGVNTRKQHGESSARNPPAAWRAGLGEFLEEARRYELQWKLGAGVDRSWKESPMFAKSFETPGAATRWMIDTDEGSVSQAQLADQWWNDAREKHDELVAERDISESMARIVLYDGKGNELFASRKPVTALDETNETGEASADPGDKEGRQDRMSERMARASNAHAARQTATVERLSASIADLAQAQAGMLSGVVAQSSAALAIQQSVVDNEAKRVEQTRDAVIHDQRAMKLFAWAERIEQRYGPAWLASKGIDPNIVPPPTNGANAPGASGAAGPIVADCRNLEDITDEQWDKLEGLNKEAFADLRTVLHLAMVYDATDDEVGAAFKAAGPAIEPYTAAASGILTPSQLAAVVRIKTAVANL